MLFRSLLDENRLRGCGAAVGGEDGPQGVGGHGHIILGAAARRVPLVRGGYTDARCRMVAGIDDERLGRAVRLLCAAAQPTRVLLFGSHARGDARADSDIDLLVVLPAVVDRVAETVRLNRLLSPLRLPVDLVVVSEATFEYWSDTPGNLYSAALAEGKILHEQAA